MAYDGVSGVPDAFDQAFNGNMDAVKPLGAGFAVSELAKALFKQFPFLQKTLLDLPQATYQNILMALVAVFGWNSDSYFVNGVSGSMGAGVVFSVLRSFGVPVPDMNPFNNIKLPASVVFGIQGIDLKRLNSAKAKELSLQQQAARQEAMRNAERSRSQNSNGIRIR